MDGFGEMVAMAWITALEEPDPYCRITARLKSTARQLMSWSDKVVTSGCSS